MNLISRLREKPGWIQKRARPWAETAGGSVETVLREASKELRKMLLSELPRELEALIKSFLPKPPMPYVHVPGYFSFNYMSIEDWNDTEEVKAYGDY